MTEKKQLLEIDRSTAARLRLVVGANDPPRYYLLDRRQRCELVAIGDAQLARKIFMLRVERWKQFRPSPRFAIISSDSVGQWS